MRHFKFRRYLFVFYFLLFKNMLYAATNSSYYHLPISSQELKEFAYSKQWLKLLHYSETTLGKYKSKSDGKHFFFAPNGKTNPLAELEATIQAFQQEDLLVSHKLAQHSQCAFPARFKIINQAFKIHFPAQICEDYEEWREGINAKSVSLIFSSAYPNSPPSMFGHTFLRLDREEMHIAQSNSKELLNYSVSFAADTGEVNPISFLVRGLLGGFEGHFFIAPYYMKIAEYIVYERRDIWEYKLNFTPAEVDLLVAHLWELYANNHFDYYFFDENCSYHLFGFLEAVKIDWELTNESQFFVLPSESLKTMIQIPNAVISSKFRPSHRSVLFGKLSKLSAAEQSRTLKLILAPHELTEEKNPVILESLIDFLHFQKAKQKGELDDQKSHALDVALLQRAQLPRTLQNVTDEKNETPTQSAPHLGHAPRTIGISARIQNRIEDQKYSLQGRGGFHNLMDPTIGFDPLSGVEYLKYSLEFDKKTQGISLNSLTIVEINSLHYFNNFDPQPSWKFSFGIQSGKTQYCPFCYFLNTEGGIGAARTFSNKNHIVYSMALLSIYYNPTVTGLFSLVPQINAGAIFNIFQENKIAFEGRIFKSINKKEKVGYAFKTNFNIPFHNTYQIETSYNYSSNPFVQNPGFSVLQEFQLGIKRFF